MHSRCSALPFSLSLIFLVAMTAKHRHCPLRALPAGCASRYALRRGLRLRAHPRVGLACLARCLYYFAFSLCGPWLLKSSSRNMVTACNNSRLSRCSCSSSDSTKLLLAPSTPYCVIASSYVLNPTVFRRLLLCPINHHLVDWRDFPQYLRHLHCTLALARATIPAASSSACSIYRVGFHLASSRASQLFAGFYLLPRSLYGPLGASGV